MDIIENTKTGIENSSTYEMSEKPLYSRYLIHYYYILYIFYELFALYVKILA